MYIPRQLSEIISKNKKNLLLLGPRQTGKSTLIKRELRPDLLINLSDESTYLEFAQGIVAQLNLRMEGDWSCLGVMQPYSFQAFPGGSFY